MRFERRKFDNFHSGAETCRRMGGLMADHPRHDKVIIDFSKDRVSTAPDPGTDEDQKKREDKESADEEGKMPECSADQSAKIPLHRKSP